jgi:DNA helicase-4
VIEWIVIGGIAAALGRGLLKGHKEPAAPLMLPKPTPLSTRANSAEQERQFTAWLAMIEAQVDRTRWIPSGAVDRLAAKHPPPPQAFDLVGFSRRLSAEKAGRPDPYGLRAKLDAHNASFLSRQQLELKAFFDKVEKSPLTDEQVHACICMDDHVLVVAAAGSGKTSTMVAKAGYVLRQGLATPDQILLLAFNRAAADELGERLKERLADFPGIEKVTANTFDGFGLSVIGEVTGKKPPVAKWVSDRKDIDEVIDIAQALGASDPAFKQDWDLFRTVYARDVGSVGERADPEDFDGKRQEQRRAADLQLALLQRRQLRLRARLRTRHGQPAA